MANLERLELSSVDILERQRDRLKELFPEVFTEGGKIELDRLKLTLGEMVDTGKERYGMNWPGKAECFRAIQTPSLGTLVPVRGESVNFDETENLIIEGDNLEVLKLLQKAYLAKVKMIYIDPPYNTGNDFIYPDNYSESLETYLRYTGQTDVEGRKFSTNAETDGRFHSKWLNMMYPRLFLARNLLRDDGVIFISIDDHEVDNLKRICNEVFGEENFVATIIWEKVYSPKSTAKFLSENHDYVMLYARSKEEWSITLLPRTEEQNARYQNPDNDPRGAWKPGDLSARNYYSKGKYPIKCPGGRLIEGPPSGSYWRYSEERFWELDRDNRIWWGEDRNQVPAIKRFLSEVKQGIVPETIWPYGEVGHTQEAKKELLEYVEFQDTDNVLDTVKPTRLIQRMLQIATTNNEQPLILDFFAGSGSTGHGVIRQNLTDAGNRSFILIQLPEPLPKPEGRLKTISDITKERIRSVVEKLHAEHESKLPLTRKHQGLGFRLFRLQSSNFKLWNAGTPQDTEKLAKQLDLHIDHILPGRSQEDILYEILLKSGFSLSTRIEVLTLADKTVFSIAEGAMLICPEKQLTPELIKAIAEKKPERVVCLDEGFAGNDQLKTNAVQTMKAKGVVSFRTV